MVSYILQEYSNLSPDHPLIRTTPAVSSSVGSVWYCIYLWCCYDKDDRANRFRRRAPSINTGTCSELNSPTYEQLSLQQNTVLYPPYHAWSTRAGGGSVSRAGGGGLRCVHMPSPRVRVCSQHHEATALAVHCSPAEPSNHDYRGLLFSLQPFTENNSPKCLSRGFEVSYTRDEDFPEPPASGNPMFLLFLLWKAILIMSFPIFLPARRDFYFS
jgi:hypothetical protein